MPANFRINRLAGRLGPIKKDPRILVRAALGVLLAANVVAALILFKPWAASVDEMGRQLSQLRLQTQQKQTSVERLKSLAKKAVRARQEGDQFMKQYFLDRRTAASTIVGELKDAAQQAGIEQKVQSYSNYEPIEGSDNLSMLAISVNYEGAYENLVKFINRLDRSSRFLILDTLTASPQRNAGLLNVTLKMNVFVIESPRDRIGRAETAERSAPVRGEAAGT